MEKIFNVGEKRWTLVWGRDGKAGKVKEEFFKKNHELHELKRISREKDAWMDALTKDFITLYSIYC